MSFFRFIHPLPYSKPIFYVIAFACVLRFWNFFEIPFTHDEYSSLGRSSYNTINEVIENGVMNDAHPPLSQFIYYYLIKIGGTAEWWIKLPFLLMGIVSVAILFLIAQKWFGKTSALISASLFAVLQESVMHSQIARPYSLGVFFILLATYALQHIVIEKELKLPWRYITMASLSLALAALSHHFAMWTAFLLSVFFLLAYAKKWKSLILVYAVSFVIYLPNLPILFAQLKLGGIGSVLSEPEPKFLGEYIFYVFNLSWWLTALVGMLIVLSFFRSAEKRNIAAIILCSSIFLLTFLAGYIYSIKVAPVLVYRALFFVLPFFLMALFSSFRELSLRSNGILTALVLLVGSATLVFERHYYQVFYTDGYSHIISEVDKLSHDANSAILVAYSPDKLAYQHRKQNIDISAWHNPDSLWRIEEYVAYIDTTPTDQFIFGYTWQFYRPPMEVLGLLYDRYGHLKLHQDYFNSNLFVFDKVAQNADAGYVQESLIRRDLASELQTMNGPGAVFHEQNEFGYKLSMEVPNEEVGIPDWLISAITVKGKALTEALLVVEVKEKDEMIHYDARNFEQFRASGDSIFTAYNGLLSPDIFKKGHHYTVNTYVWNRGSDFQVLDFKILRIKGNPIMYCLDRKIDAEDLHYLPRNGWGIQKSLNRVALPNLSNK